MRNGSAFDLCVVGAGAGGLAVAAGAARMGARVALVEAARMGGECLHAGCVPSKALLAAAAHARAIRRAADFGIRAELTDVSFTGLRAWIARAVATVAPRDSVERFERMGVRVLRGFGRFVAPDALEVDGRTVRARHFVIATGSAPRVPDLPGLEDVPHLTNETVFDLEVRPERLLVVGGGPVGVEIAQAMARLGVPVVLVQRRRILPRLPAWLVAPVREALRAEGVELFEHTRVERVTPGPTLHLARNDQRFAVTGSHLLLATGRRPRVEGLGLEVAGIACDARGIRTDRRLRTTNRRVYAIGDVTGRRLFTHAALQQAGVVLQNTLLGIPARVHDALVPESIFTDPEVIAAGRLEEGDGLRLVEVPVVESDRAATEARTDGCVRLLVDRRHRLVGVGIVAPHAAEIFAPFAPILAAGGRLGGLARSVLPYPTYAELARRAAGAVFEPLVFGPWMRRWVRLRRRFA